MYFILNKQQQLQVLYLECLSAESTRSAIASGDNTSQSKHVYNVKPNLNVKNDVVKEVNGMLSQGMQLVDIH